MGRDSEHLARVRISHAIFDGGENMNIFVIFLTMTVMVAQSQFLTEDDQNNENSVCGSQDCVIISKCPSVLKLVFKVKAGDSGARSQLLSLQCGFEKSLPKVCCLKNGPTEAPRIFVNSQTVPSNLPTGSSVLTPPFTTSTTSFKTADDVGVTTTEKAETRNSVQSPASNFSVLNAPGCGGGGLTDLFTRITFGSSAKSGQFPWLAALVYRNSRGSGVPLCGAALVSTHHLLTAAHCTGTQAGFRLTSAILGQIDLAAKVSLPGLEVDIARVVSHPEFTQDPVAVNDLAVIKLVRPVSFTDHIRPICLYQLPESEFPSADEEFTVAGWGRTERARSSSVLQYTHLQGVTAEDCSLQYSRAGAQGQLGPLKQL